MLTEILIQPALTGLSMGVFCLGTCFPFLASLIAAEERPWRRNLILMCQFLGGRLIGYILFGIVFGWLGEKLDSRAMALTADIALILMSIVLILYLTGILRHKDKACPAGLVPAGRSAILIGFLMGVNLCPPFLLSITYVVSLHDTIKSIIYFIVLFLTSSVFFLPIALAGWLAKIKELQTAARFSGIMASGIFIIYAGHAIITRLIPK
jgi:sulfite exporter TauE/SafE